MWPAARHSAPQSWQLEDHPFGTQACNPRRPCRLSHVSIVRRGYILSLDFLLYFIEPSFDLFMKIVFFLWCDLFQREKMHHIYLDVTEFVLFLFNECLLIVQGQRQHINGPRIKWQQRGVVEHNPSWSNTTGMQLVYQHDVKKERVFSIGIY